MENPYQGTTRAKLYEFLTEYSHTVEEFSFIDPGLYWSYSNAGVGLLGEILAEQKRMTYEELATKEIFEVLGMKSTHVTKESPELAKVYHKEQLSHDWIPGSPWTLPGIPGAGGIRSSLEDMQLFLKANLGLHSTTLDQTLSRGQDFLPEATQRLNSNICKADQTPAKDLCNPALKDLYLAWESHGPFLYHGGATGASQSMIMFKKDKSLGVVILSNSSLRKGEQLVTHYPNNLALQLLQMADHQ